VNKPSEATLRACAFALGFLAGAPAFAQAPGPTGSEGEALYLQMHRVLTHPRCLNCHPKGESPRQGDLRQIHTPPITRGPGGHGPAGIQCGACHQTKNYAASGVPGAPGWHLAPQVWEGKTPGELCRSLVDRRTNGNKSLAEIVTHLTQDELVAWGWSPGKDVAGTERAPVPIAKPEFNRIVQAWAKTGAVCPR
jgi:hypothetical protein